MGNRHRVKGCEALTQKDSKQSDMLVTSQEIAKIFGVTTARIRQLTKENAVVRSGRGQYDLPKSFKAYIEYLDSKNETKLDKQKEDALWTRARREKTELQVKIIKGELHRSEDVERVLNDMLGNFRGKLISIPSKIAPRVAGKTNLTEIRDTIKNAIYDAMSELAEYDPTKFYEVSTDDIFVDEEVDIDD